MKPHAINWTEATWNPFVGCSKVSPGCENCYAIRMAWRLAHIPATSAIYKQVVKKTDGGKLNWTGILAENYPSMDKPLRTKVPTIFFVNSMSDLFHETLTFEQIHSVYEVMEQCPQHTFQILTKRPKRMAQFYKWKEEVKGYKPANWPLKNVWLGTSVENQKQAKERIYPLLYCPAKVHFVSCEPLLGPLDLNEWLYPSEIIKCTNCGFMHVDNDEWLKRPHHNHLCEHCNTVFDNKIRSYGYLLNKKALDWVIVGGESGPGSRPMHPDWVRSIRDQSAKANVPFLFKQWGDWYTRWTDLTDKGDHPQVFKMFDSFRQWVNKGASWLHIGDACISIDGTRCEIGGHFMECEYPVAIMNRVGKHASGNLLDGKTHLEIPGN